MSVQMDRLSYSRLDLYRSCPRSFAMKYVHKAEPANGTTDHFSEYGTLAHALYESHSNANGLIPKTALIDMFYNGTETRDGMVKGFNKINFGGTFYRARDTYHDQGISLIDRLTMRNTSNIIASEVEFNIVIREDLPRINGYIDRLVRDEHGIKVVDFKSARPYEQEFCDTSLQLSIYAMAVAEMYNGELPYELEYEFFRFDEYRRTTRTHEQLEDAKQEIISIWESIQREEFEPKYDDFFCDHFCSWRVGCPLYQQAQEVKAAKRAAKLAKQQQSKGGEQ